VIGIVAAMREELAAILEAARAEGPVRTETVAGVRLEHGRLAGREVVLALSGIGKVAAATTATLLCERADALVMVGTAGGIGDGVAPGDVVVASATLQHDFDARPLWPQRVLPSLGLEQIPTDPALTGVLFAAAERVCAEHRADLAALGLASPRAHRGLVVSGDVFVATAEASATLRADLPEALAVEMEGAAVAQVCHVAGVPFGLVRTISDRADADAALDFPVFLRAVAAPYAHDLVLTSLRRLS
jgi:adenosylhomocysteine nucleosidase